MFFLAGIKNIHLGNIIFWIKIHEILVYVVFFLILIVCSLVMVFLVIDIQISTWQNINWELPAIGMAIIILFASIIFQSWSNLIQYYHYLGEEEIAQREDRLNNIEGSLNFFYLPLSVLLTIPDQPENAQARAHKIAEINCNKHLAEPRVRAVFERYMEGKKDPKLLELVYRDIENLQKKYTMEKQLLAEE